MSIIDLCALSLAAVACLSDLKSARIPNALTFSAAGLAVIFHTFAPDGHGFAAALGGMLVGLLVFLPMFVLGGMGGGDVKLMAALGAWVGWYPVIYIGLYGSIAGGVLGVLFALTRGYLPQAMRNIRMLLSYWWIAGVKPLPALTLDSATALRLPYAVPIAVGVVVTLWVR